MTPRQQADKPGLELEAVSFSFGAGERQVLACIEAEVAPGELVGLVGPNGAGKSTLLRLCAGLLHPTAGTVRVLGKELCKWQRAALARECALVPQIIDSPFSFTVEEVVLMGRAPHMGALGLERPDDLRVAAGALEEMDLAVLAGRPIDRISGGERQRAFIARALAQEPRLLLCDEPTAHLDLRHQSRLFKALRRRVGNGASALVVLHDLNLAAAACDRLLLLSHGSIVASGSPEEVLRQDLLQKAYESPLTTGADPVSGRRYVLPQID